MKISQHVGIDSTSSKCFFFAMCVYMCVAVCWSVFIVHNLFSVTQGVFVHVVNCTLSLITLYLFVTDIVSVDVF